MEGQPEAPLTQADLKVIYEEAQAGAEGLSKEEIQSRIDEMREEMNNADHGSEGNKIRKLVEQQMALEDVLKAKG